LDDEIKLGVTYSYHILIQKIYILFGLNYKYTNNRLDFFFK